MHSQSKLDYYNSAIQSSLLKSLDESQKAQVEAQLTKNERLDPGLNYYYLKANFPANGQLKEVYNNQRIITAYIHNNYLLNWKEEILNLKFNSLFFESIVSRPINELIIKDILDIQNNKIDNHNQDDENFKFYFRLLTIDPAHKVFYKTQSNYKQLFSDNINEYLNTIKNICDSLDAGNERKLPEGIFSKMLILQSLLNTSGESETLTIAESLAKRFVISFYKLNYQRNGGEPSKYARFAMFNFQFGNKFYFAGNNFSKTYNVNNPKYGYYGIPFKIEQDIVVNNYLFATLFFFPMMYTDFHSILSGSYIYISLGINSPLTNITSINKVDEKTKFSYYKIPTFESIKERNITTSEVEVKNISLISLGLNFPIHDYNKIFFFETGMSFDYMSYEVDSRFKYRIDLKTKYINTQPQNDVSYQYYIDETTEQFHEELKFIKINCFGKIRTASFYGFRSDLVFGTHNSYVQIYWEL